MRVLVVTLQIVKPDRAAGWNDERSCLIGAARLFPAGADEAEAQTIVECADFKRVVCFCRRMVERDGCAAYAIYRFRMDAAPGVRFIDLKALPIAGLRTLRQIDSIDRHRKGRRFDGRPLVMTDLVTQPAVLGGKLKFHGPARARHLDDVGRSGAGANTKRDSDQGSVHRGFSAAAKASEECRI